jgi:Overcoming lysogenization defect protein-like, TOPRIM domain
LRLTTDEVKAVYDQLAWHGNKQDPLRSFHDLFRMAPDRERAKLRRGARRAQDAFDAAEMIRRFYHDLTGELLPRPDAMTDASDGSWRTRLYGHEPRLGYDRHDLQVALRVAHLDPHIVHVVVEGKSEEILFKYLIESLTGRAADTMGITFSNLEGVGHARLHRRILRIAKTLARFPILVADREGDIERDVADMQRDGLLTDETTFLWDDSLEEDNFTADELVAVASGLAEGQGATLTLTGGELREAADREKARGDKDAKGLAEVLRKLAASPEHGSAVITKPDLARALARALVDELRNADDAEAVFKRRPLLDIVASIIRVA